MHDRSQSSCASLGRQIAEVTRAYRE